jgi:hypothetical protein
MDDQKQQLMYGDPNQQMMMMMSPMNNTMPGTIATISQMDPGA